MNYRNLYSSPAVPTKVSKFENDSNYITEAIFKTRMREMPVQENSDWSSTTGVTQILNKPTSFNPAPHTHDISSVVGLQPALDDKISVGAPIPYGTLTGTPNIPAAQVPSDWNSSTYPTQILNKPSLAVVAITGAYNDLIGKPNILQPKRIEIYTGSTNASGNFSVTYASPFTSVPDVQPQLQSSTPSQVARITSNTTSGFTVQVTNRASANLLGLELLLAATTPVASSQLSVLVTAKE